MSSDLDKVKRMLSRYNFEVDNEDLTCVMCKRLMRDVHQTSCGSNYCHECILAYLNGDKKKCKGSKKECQEEYLVMNETVTRNVKLNKDISRLEVRCPNKPCTFNKELTEMEDHLEECSEKPTECPFFVVGCNLKRERKSKIIDHLHQEPYDHSVKLIKVVEDLKYALQSVEEESRKKEDKLIKEMESMKEKKKIKEQGREIETLSNGFNESRKESKEWKETSGKIANQSVKESNLQIENLKERIEALHLRTNVLGGEILFKVDGFSRRRTLNERIMSPSFYSNFNEYKLKLLVYPGGLGRGKGTHLSLFFIFCKGEYDDKLSWPCKYLIKLSVFNQRTGDDYISRTWNYSSVKKSYQNYFNKPIDKDNTGLGCHIFISHKDIMNEIGILVNDVVVLKCTVTVPQ